MRLPPIFALTLLASLGCGGPTYDVVIRGGTVYNGSDSAGIVADVAIQGDSIVAVGNLGAARGRQVIDAQGLAVAPGFINMLSWANEALLVDGKSQSDIRQGVTLEIFGEGESMGPLTPAMKAEWEAAQGDIRFPITWTTLAGYLDTLVHRGVSPNVASFVGAATVRQYVLGHDPRQATKSELAQMQQLVGEAMADGALGVGSSLIYEPGMFATSTELEWLAQIAAARGGIYISHIRNEGDSLFEALDEFLGIAARAGARAEIYHLKTSGPRNWDKEDELLTRIEEARSKGLKVTADMYTYPASATGLDAVMPGWVRAGGFAAWAGRLQDPATRRRLKPEVTAALVKVAERTMSCWSASRTTRSSTTPARRWRRWPRREEQDRKKRRWIWSTRTTAGSVVSTSPCPRRMCGSRFRYRGSASGVTRQAWRPRGSSSSPIRIRAPMAPLRDCSASMFGTRSSFGWNRRSTA